MTENYCPQTKDLAENDFPECAGYAVRTHSISNSNRYAQRTLRR